MIAGLVAGARARATAALLLMRAKAAFSWLTATVRQHGSGPRTTYRLDGVLAPEGGELDVPGCRGNGPVRVGDQARDQLRLGLLGDVLERAVNLLAIAKLAAVRIWLRHHGSVPRAVY